MLTPRAHFALAADITFLNHGSFGACPRAVLDQQAALRARMEAQPVQFLARDLEGLLDEALAGLAAFLGADPMDLAFVSNATSGVNAVLRSLALRAGDEILVTDHGYPACRNTAAYVAGRAGARVIEAQVPFPLRAADQVVEAVLAAVTPRTRLALLDHVTSPTGLVFPIATLVEALAARGIDTLVDGAHAPGMVPLDLGALGAAYYTGNCHKWLCAPKGAAFLHVRRDRQDERDGRNGIVPLTISHGATATRTDKSRFRLLFDWTGTADPTAALCVPAALRVMATLADGGWPGLMAHNRALALRARALLCEALGVEPPAPDDMIGSLVSLPLPGAAKAPAALAEALWREERIEVPVFPWPAPVGALVRVAAQIYNTPDEYQRLAAALRRRDVLGDLGST